MQSTFTRRTLITFVSQALGFLAAMATSIIVARVLGPHGKGVYSLALVVPSLLVSLTSVGIGPAAAFYAGKRFFPPQDILGNNILSSLLLGVVAMAAGVIVILFWSAKIFPGVETRYLFLGLPVISLSLLFGSTNYLFLGLRNLKWYNFFPLFRTVLLLTILGTFFLGFHWGIGAGIVAEILAFTIASVVLFFIARKEAGGVSFHLNKAYLKSSYSYGIKVHLATILTFLHYRLDLFLINLFMNPAMVGFYSLSAGLSERIQSIADAAGVVLFSRMASEEDSDRIKEFTPLVLRSILMITAFAAIIIFFLGAWLIPILYSEAFRPAVKPLRILLISAVALSGSYILESDFKGRGRPIFTSYAVGGGLIMNVVLNLILIPRYGIVGSAWASSISYTTTFLIFLSIYSKISEHSIKDILSIRAQDFRFYGILLQRIILRRQIQINQ